MSNLAIRAEALGKRYRIGAAAAPYQTIREAILDAARSPFRNLRRLNPPGEAERAETFWALRDVSFEVKHGEVLGIVGRNGAGKSTLLKVLSRITEPTVGRAVVNGRIGSLLEVGTGFHPELSGRENIFLNGSILGMDRPYISAQFNQIVEFAGVERFIDTPVKRYSSGMYLRLAFAVAAFLEPEILIVDEVLAVGDAEFQQKCLGRMGEVAKEGRTVLFVSHNMGAVRALCSRALLMRGGRVVEDADVESVLDEYLVTSDSADAEVVWDSATAPQSPEMRFVRAVIRNPTGEPAALLDCRGGFTIDVEYEIRKPVKGLRVGFFMQNAEGVPICGSNDPDAWQGVRNPGRYRSRCEFPGYTLNAGRYLLYFAADVPPSPQALATTDYCLSFTIEDVEGHGIGRHKLPGVLRPRLDWAVQHLSPSPPLLKV